MAKIIIKSHENVKLDIPSFVVDKPITKEPLPLPFDLMNRSSSSIFLGPPASGKTSLMVSLVSQRKPKLFYKAFDKVCLVMPSHSRASLKKDVFKNISKIENDLTDDVIDDITYFCEKNSDEKENTLLILDDVTASLKRSKYIQDKLAKLLFNRRHLRTSVWIMVQSYKAIPLQIRKNLDNLFVFKISKSEQESLYQECFEIDKDIVQKIMYISYNKPHNWVFLNVPEQRIFTNNFDELIIEED